MEHPLSGSLHLTRRQLLWAAAATGVLRPDPRGSGAGAAEQPAGAIEVIRIGPAKRPRSDLEAWNVGLITAARPELSAADNQARNRALWDELSRFGRLHLRGRYRENDGVAAARTLQLQAYLVIGKSDDSGNLKGMLRKLGRKYQQDAVIHKGYYRDAELHALKHIPNLGVSNGGTWPLGRFQPSRLAAFLTLVTRCTCHPAPAGPEEVALTASGTDWLGGRWHEIGLFTPGTFFNPTERQIVFDDTGNLYQT